MQGIVLNEMKSNSDLPYREKYIDSYGYDGIEPLAALLYAAVQAFIIFVVLVYAIRAKKVARVVL